MLILYFILQNWKYNQGACASMNVTSVDWIEHQHSTKECHSKGNLFGWQEI